MKRTTVVNVRGKQLGVDYDVYIGRQMRAQYASPITLPGGAVVKPGYFGNRFKVLDGAVEAAVAAYAQDFHERIESDPSFRANVGALRGLRLGCWCVDENGEGPCHGQVLAEYLNSGR